MAQLPPNRRLHPTALRKDHWVPLLKAEFKDSSTMRQIYTRLLEYRKWRSEEPVLIERRKMTTKARRSVEINQVATSVADLSASCATFAKNGPVSIRWLNPEEQVYAKRWPANVKHGAGLSVERGYIIVEDDLVPTNTATDTKEATAQLSA